MAIKIILLSWLALLASAPVGHTAINTHPGPCSSEEWDSGCHTIFWVNGKPPTCACPDYIVIAGPWK